MKRLSHFDRQRYVLYFSGHRPPDVHRRSWVPIFTDPGEALTVINRFFGDRHRTIDGDTITLTDTPFSMRCQQLADVLEADPVPVLDEYLHLAQRFRLGSWDEKPVEDEPTDEPATADDGAPKPKAAKPAKPSKAAKPDGYVTIGEWCTKWKLKPMDARAALRGSGLVKPEYGWAFDPKREKEIKKICGVK